MNIKKIGTALIALVLSITTSVPFLVENESAKTAYLFSHGLGGCKRQAHPYTRYQIIDDPYFSFNYLDALHEDQSYATFGQEDDIACIRGAYNSICNTVSETNKMNIVLVGVSRGASTVLTFTAKHKPSCVKALIVESPFDSIDTVLELKVKHWRLTSVPFVKTISRKTFSKIFPKYKHNGIKPINVVADIPKDLPILIVCSKKDALVPWYSSARLYVKLLETEHPNVHLLVLDRGKHATMIFEDEGEIYQTVTHAFYKHYGLAHDDEMAQKGLNRFIMCQPEPKTLSLDSIK